MDNNQLDEFCQTLRAMGITRAQILLVAFLVFINFCVAVAAIQDVV